MPANNAKASQHDTGGTWYVLPETRFLRDAVQRPRFPANARLNQDPIESFLATKEDTYQNLSRVCLEQLQKVGSRRCFVTLRPPLEQTPLAER